MLNRKKQILDNYFPDYKYSKNFDINNLYDIVILRNNHFISIFSINNPELKNIEYYTQLKIDRPDVYLETGLVKIMEDISDKKLLIKMAKEKIKAFNDEKTYIITGIIQTDNLSFKEIKRRNLGCSTGVVKCFYNKTYENSSTISSKKICIQIFVRLLEVK